MATREDMRLNVDACIDELEWYATREKDLTGELDTPCDAYRTWGEMLLYEIGELRQALLRERGITAETPVSTLCAICDQIKELHPNTHPWTARATAETKGESNG